MPTDAYVSGACIDNDVEQAWDLETALNHVGIGRFQWLALAVCGMANAADAVEILAVSLVVPAAESDLQLTSAGKSALSSCIFLGMLLGGLVWGPMGDVLGRRTSLTVSLLLNASFGLLSAAARRVSDMVFLRFMAGVGVGGSVPVVFSFLAELLPAHARGKFMIGLAAHWMVGSIYSAGLGWAVIPGHGWRMFLVLASLPAWVSAVGNMLLMPESPRYLLVHGRTALAQKALRHMAAVNRRPVPRSFSLRLHDGATAAAWEAQSAVTAAADDDDEGTTPGNNPGLSRMQDYQGHVLSDSAEGVLAAAHSRTAAGDASAAHGRDALLGKGASRGKYDPESTLMQDSPSSSIGSSGSSSKRKRDVSSWFAAVGSGLGHSAATAKQLIKAPLRLRFGPLLIAWLGICGGWYSTVLWIPEYFKARGAGQASLYAETFAVAAANLPGNIASLYLVDKIGRRWTACSCLAGSCLCALLFAAAPADPVWSVAAASVFNAISVGGWNALDLLSAELFPTEVRSTALGLLGATGRLASFATTFLAGALMQVRLWVPLVVAAVLLAAGSVAMLLLPETALMPLDDTVEDAALHISTHRAGNTVAGSRGGSSRGASSLAANSSSEVVEHADAMLELQGMLPRFATTTPHSYSSGGAAAAAEPR